MKKNIRFNKSLLLLLVFAGFLLVPQNASAWLDIPANFSDMALGALDFMDRIIATLFWILLMAITGGIFISISAALLDWASTLSVGLNNPLVTAGWDFMSGFVNLIFILIFVAIALSYILRIETFGMKKALPRLIIVALLLNFSLLFVKMFVDVGDVFMNALKMAMFGGGAMAPPIATVVFDASKSVAGQYLVSFFLPYFAVANIPFLNVARVVWVSSTMIAGEAFMGTFSQAIVLAVFGWLGGLIFFVYTILFLARIVVIWLLAIVAPLAFAAYISPKTEKFFQQWLKALFQWVFLGVVVFFLMGLGLKFFTMLHYTSFSKVGFNFVTGFSQIIFLIIYMVVCLMAAKKFTPTGAQAIWSLAGKGVTAGGGFLFGKAVRGTMRARLWEREKTAERLKQQESALKQRLRTGRMTTDERKRLAQEFKGWRDRNLPRRELAEAQAAELRSRLREDHRKNLMSRTKDLDEEGTKAFLRAEMEKHKTNPSRDKAKTAALLRLLADKNALSDSDKKFYEEAWKAAGPADIKDNAVKKAIMAKRPDWGAPNEIKDYIAKMKVGDIDNWNNSAKGNSEIAKQIVATQRADLITRLGSQTSASSQKVQTELDRTVGDSFRKLVSGATDVTTLGDENKKKLLRQLEVARHLHTSLSPEVQTWKKYGTMESGKPDNVNDVIEWLRKRI